MIVAIGRSGNYRKLGCPGEELDKVYNRLYDPKEFVARMCSSSAAATALETAIALAASGAHVTVSYAATELARPKPENIEKVEMLVRDGSADVQIERPTSERVNPAVTSGMRGQKSPGSLTLALGTEVTRIEPEQVHLKNGTEETLPNDVVFSMIGREAPLDFFRRSGLQVRGDWTPRKWISLTLLLFCVFLYHWKKGGVYFGVSELFERNRWFPFNVPDWWASLGPAFRNRANCSAHYASRSASRVSTTRSPTPSASRSSACAVCDAGTRPTSGCRPSRSWRSRSCRCFCSRTSCLPWAGNNGWFDAGLGKTIADALFPIANYGHGREYWRAYGFILAWPLNVCNVFTDHPMWLWLGISFLQTFVIIPLIIFRWGKGAYCGWICSCGALAETMGDTQRAKMPHGPFWNRVNMVGQAVLVFAFAILGLAHRGLGARGRVLADPLVSQAF